MGIEEVEIQPRPHQQQQSQHQHPPPPPRHPHSVQRGGGTTTGAGASSSHPNHGLTLSLPLHLAAASSGKGANAPAPAREGLGGVSVVPPPNGSATPSSAGNGLLAATGSGGVDRHGQGHGHGHGRDDCWSEGATNTLIEAWGDRYLELNRGNLKQKHWKDVADAVSNRENCSKASKTDVQCKNRLDTLKKKYKLEKAKIFSGGGTSKWPFFHKLDELIGPSRKQQQHLLHNNNNKPLPTPSCPKPVKDKRPSEEQPHHNMPVMNALHMDNNHSASSKSDETPDTTDSCPNGLNMTVNGNGFKKKRFSDSPFRELSRAIIKFGEVYERVESSKQQQLMDLEKQRMEFIKDLELQRMQFFMQTQLELAKAKHGKHGNTGNWNLN
eukprot:Gb_19309 [translate_table: standard]